MDVFITLLSLGVNGYKNLISQRKEMYKYLKEELSKVASKHGEKILETKNNPISVGKLTNAFCLFSDILKMRTILTPWTLEGMSGGSWEGGHIFRFRGL